MSESQLELSNDELLSTTRAVRKRLDFERPVPMTAIKECMELAVQAPSGSNAQGWQFVFVTDPDKRAQIGGYYQQAFSLYKDMPFAIHNLHADSGGVLRKANAFCAPRKDDVRIGLDMAVEDRFELRLGNIDQLVGCLL